METNCSTCSFCDRTEPRPVRVRIARGQFVTTKVNEFYCGKHDEYVYLTDTCPNWQRRMPPRFLLKPVVVAPEEAMACRIQ